MSFSERMGFVAQKQIQKESIDTALRQRIINKVNSLFDEDQARDALDIMGYRVIPQGDIFSGTFHSSRKNLDNLISVLEKAEWYKVYDIIEYGYESIHKNCIGCNDNCEAEYDEDDEEFYSCAHYEKMNKYISQFNLILEQEKAGYRIINGTVTSIIEQSELECISEAVSSPFHSVNTHLNKAVQFYADRESPDYENSIKESISAVESMCCIITGLTGASATLGKAIKQLEDKGVVIHKSMKSAFSQLYGYTSDADGIRHGGIDFKNAPAEDAKYMLVSCAAFVNYLIEKYENSIESI